MPGKRRFWNAVPACVLRRNFRNSVLACSVTKNTPDNNYIGWMGECYIASDVTPVNFTCALILRVVFLCNKHVPILNSYLSYAFHTISSSLLTIPMMMMEI
jgi:hypothetical protein